MAEERSRERSLCSEIIRSYFQRRWDDNVVVSGELLSEVLSVKGLFTSEESVISCLSLSLLSFHNSTYTASLD